MLGGKDCPGLEVIEECPQKRCVKLKPENRIVWDFFQLASAGILTGDGGFNYSAIRETMDMVGMEEIERPYFFDRCLILINVIKNIRQETANRKSYHEPGNPGYPKR